MMNIKTIKTSIDLIKNNTIKFKLVNVESNKFNESDFDTGDSISKYSFNELRAKVVFDQPGYENFGFDVEKDISTQTVSFAEVDERGINLNDLEDSEPVTTVHYRGEVFAEKNFIDELDSVLTHEFLVGEDSLLKDIQFNEGESVSLSSYALCLLDAPLDNYLRNEHDISFDSLIKVIRKLDSIEPELKQKILEDSSDESLHELYKGFKADNSKQKEATGFNFLN